MGAAAASVIAQNGALAFMAVRAHRGLGISSVELLLPRWSDLTLLADTGLEIWRAATGRGKAVQP
jgi:hypothetical protein